MFHFKVLFFLGLEKQWSTFQDFSAQMSYTCRMTKKTKSKRQSKDRS
jgi:hypothetical protein